MEGLIARWYTTSTGQSRDEFAKLARRIAGELTPGSAVLGVASGPGYFCMELAKLGDYSITGLDISRTFVEIGAKKAAEAGVRLNFRQRALQEMCRVLKPGGARLDCRS